MDFQNQVNTVPAPAVEGDFADHNPRASVIAGPGGLVAGSNGVVIGRFAWMTTPIDIDGTPTVVNNTGSGAPDGFVHRAQQAAVGGVEMALQVLRHDGWGCGRRCHAASFASGAGSSRQR